MSLFWNIIFTILMTMLFSGIVGLIASYIDDESVISEIAIISFFIELLSFPITIILHIWGFKQFV